MPRNGPPFQGEDFKTFSKVKGFEHRRITPYWPKANSEAERFMRTFGKDICTANAERSNWRMELNQGSKFAKKKHLRMPQVRLNNYLRQEIFTCTYLLAPLSALSVLFAGTVLSLSALSFSRFPLNLNANRVLCFFMMI